MRKNIISMFFAICVMVWLLPINTYASTTLTWAEILDAIGDGGNSVSETMWSYDSGTITINSGITVEGNNEIEYQLINSGTIKGGTFLGSVVMQSGTIEGGTFVGQVTDIGTIKGGTFSGLVELRSGTIEDGLFLGPVEYATGTIKGGIFSGSVKLTAGIIENGTFLDQVRNVSYYGTIKGGKFIGQVINNGKIEGGMFKTMPEGGTIAYDKIIVDETLSSQDDNVNPTPGGNNESNHDNDIECVFVEPVVIVVPEGQKYADDVMEQLSVIPTDGKILIDTKDWCCFNRTIAEKITNMKNVTVTVHYMYQGKKYEVIIPAGSDIVSLLDETGFVGFRYLDLVFGGREL